MYKQVIHKMEDGAERYSIIAHEREECECSPRKVVAYKNVGKPNRSLVVTYIHNK